MLVPSVASGPHHNSLRCIHDKNIYHEKQKRRPQHRSILLIFFRINLVDKAFLCEYLITIELAGIAEEILL